MIIINPWINLKLNLRQSTWELIITDDTRRELIKSKPDFDNGTLNFNHAPSNYLIKNLNNTFGRSNTSHQVLRVPNDIIIGWIQNNELINLD